MVHEVVERRESFFYGSSPLEAVNLIEVDCLDAQSFQTRLAALHDVLARDTTHVRTVAHWEMDFGREYDLVQFGHLSEGTACYFLADAQRIHVGGVEEIDPELERFLEERPRVHVVENPGTPFWRPVGHAAETDPRDNEAASA